MFFNNSAIYIIVRNLKNISLLLHDMILDLYRQFEIVFMGNKNVQKVGPMF